MDIINIQNAGDNIDIINNSATIILINFVKLLLILDLLTF